ncbi:uncharacterized protein LOC143200330 isoform X2 [Rhynchophorus ferrugineus]|uniref:uncharacterized protein LOC143200330 isoform X2 n=1 Tax=Rhynchophorus ferrugineus TaxID=354439 RepID=UPI003FCD0A8D
MNQDHPFFSTNTNLYDGSVQSSTNATLNGQNVIVSQGQQRQVCDIFKTSVTGNPFQMNPAFQPQVMQAQKLHIPGGVCFSFSPSIPQETCKCCQNIKQNNSLFPIKSLFPSSLEQTNRTSYGFIGPLNHNYPENRYKLRLHYNESTSTSDLLEGRNQIPVSMGFPDLSGICGYLHQLRSPNGPVDTTAPTPREPISSARKLVLQKKTEPITAHVVDVLDEPKNANDKKKVSFSGGPRSVSGTQDQAVQISNDCSCGVKKCKQGPFVNAEKASKKRKKKKNKTAKADESSEDTSQSASEDSTSKDSTSQDSTPSKLKYLFTTLIPIIVLLRTS